MFLPILFFATTIFATLHTRVESAILASKAPLATHAFSLEKRYGNTFVNGVFKDNILLTLMILKNGEIPHLPVDWEAVRKPFHFDLTLQPGETFAFHDNVLPQYQGKPLKVLNAHFNSQEGFVSDGYLVGDGVCHLASLLSWTAKDAGLSVTALVNHDFAPIPEVPREQGVSIFANPSPSTGAARQNLYITNTKESDVRFRFTYDGGTLTIEVLAATS